MSSNSVCNPTLLNSCFILIVVIFIYRILVSRMAYIQFIYSCVVATQPSTLGVPVLSCFGDRANPLLALPLCQRIINNYPAKSREYRLIIVNETLFVARITVVVRRFARFRTNLGDLRISQDICYR